MEIAFLVSILLALVIVCFVDHSRKRREYIREQEKLLAFKEIQNA